MDESFSNLQLPTFSLHHLVEFRREVELWSQITTLPKSKQALAIAYILPQNVKSHVLSQLSVSKDLSSNAGLDMLLEFLDENYLVNQMSLRARYSKFVQTRPCLQEANEGLSEFVSRFEAHKQAEEEDSVELRWTFNLLAGSTLSPTDITRFLEQLDDGKLQPDDKIFDRAKEMLRCWNSTKKRKLDSTSQEVDEENSISQVGLLDLPNEILKKVLHNLDTADIVSLRSVNSRLHQIVEEFCPWRVLAPSVYSFNALDSLLNHIKKCKNLVELQLPSIRCSSDFNALYAQVAASCPRLQSLSVTIFDRHDLDYLAFLFESCSEIKKLKLKSSELVLIDLRALKMMGSRLPHLTHLDIADNFMDPLELTYISQKLRNLEYLVLQVYGNSDEESNNAIKLIGERCTGLRVLKLKGFTINACSLQSIQDNCKNLQTFLLNPNREIDADDLKNFGKKSRKLVDLHLKVGDMDNITFSMGASAMLDHLLSLESFHLYEERRSEFPLPILERLAEKCTQLRELCLYLYGDGNQISMSLRTYLQSAGSNNLEKIAIRYNCETQVRPLREVAKCCPNLKVLHLGKVVVPELDLLHILRGCSKLESLILAEVDAGSWTCDIGRFCPKLRMLSSNCLNTITTVSLIKNCKNLQKLDLTGEIIDIEDLKDLANLEQLEFLRLMTGDHDVLGLGSVLSSCRRLKQIYINYSTEEKKQLRLLLDRPVRIQDRTDMSTRDNPWTVEHLMSLGFSFGPFAMLPT